MSSSECRLTYQGDDALAGLLAKAGSALSVAELRALIAGVLGAAPARDPAAWIALVAEHPSPALTAQLQALKAEIAAAEAPAAAADAAEIARRLNAVRDGMKRQGFDAFLVPRADEYQNEYVPARGNRLAWLTGFSGSAGLAVVLADHAVIFVDGRYTVQVRAEVPAALFTPLHLIEDPPEAWIGRGLGAGQVLGYDPWVLSPVQVERFRQAVETAGAVLKPAEWNPLDAAWTTRPAAPLGPVVAHPLEFAGKSSAEKREEIGRALARDKRDAVVLTAPDSIAWLLNIRGADVPNTPLALAFALLDAEGRVDLFIDRRKLTPGLDAHLGNGVALRDPDELGPALDALADRTVQLDRAGAKIHRAADPVSLPKALKNPVELAGARAAHRRDGVAMVKFLHWLDQHLDDGLTEIEASDQLERFRQPGTHFRDLSFSSISAAGPNAALPHYHAAPDSRHVIEPGSFYLIDSGAQYLDGTTDITRTIAVGTPSAEMRDRYTRVLKGHIALATARFPKGTTGSALDALARLPLWQAGLNFDHGTGHGIGSYLSVHEGPHRIASIPNHQALLPGMIVSNEPGYYQPGGYGIRIENLVIVVPAEIPGAEREMFGFDTITLAPIDKTAIEPDLLSPAEIAWLDEYHRRVYQTLAPDITDPAALDWLAAKTGPLLG
jgi:Xaa-Pro aminopeptidase